MTITVHDEVSTQVYREAGADWQLFFYRCTYHMDDEDRDGFRFMWRRNGKLQTTRGQARIHSPEQLVGLLEKAMQAGWFSDKRLRIG